MVSKLLVSIQNIFHRHFSRDRIRPLAVGNPQSRKSEIEITQLRAGECLIDIVVDSELGKRGDGAPTLSENNLDHFYLQIEPFNEKLLTHFLKNKNIKIEEFETRYGTKGNGRAIYVKDPDGNTVELPATKTGS